MSDLDPTKPRGKRPRGIPSIKRAKPARRQLVLIGSMSVYPELCAYAEMLNDAGINTVVPEPEQESVHQFSLPEMESFKREVSLKHIRQIRRPETWGVLAVNIDRHGILNYIGPNTFAEIAVAFAQFKKIYLLHGTPQFYLDELSAWQAIPLRGQIDILIEDFMEATQTYSKQMNLFE
jgi:hypothetical protein